MKTLRDRIKEHRRVRAGDLLPHPLNWRVHPIQQKDALLALYDEVGFARSLLAYELPDGRLQIIDGHLRRDLTPDAEVMVEILDVTEAEARTLILSLDPLATLATADDAALRELRQLTTTDSPALQQLWDALGSASAMLPESESATPAEPPIHEQWLILITCASEAEQAELLEQFQRDGIRCKPLCS